MRDRRQTRATLGFLADMVPSGVVAAAGRAGAGTSLDNAMRFGPAPDTDWMLLEYDPYFITGVTPRRGPDLVAGRGTARRRSQTASTLLFD